MNLSVLREKIRNAPSDTPLVLRNLRAPSAVLPEDLRRSDADGLCDVDIILAKSRIASIEPAAEIAQTGIDMAKRIVWPSTVDCHTHIDKGHVWARSPNPDGTFAGAIRTSGADLERYQTPGDVAARAEFALRCAYAHGTGLLRSHVDSNPDTFDARFDLLSGIAQDWSGRIDVQLCPFTGRLDDLDWVQRLFEATRSKPIAALSFFIEAGPDLGTTLDRVFRAAIKYDVALDFHADETVDAGSHCLEAIARAALRHRYDRPIVVGHCCALSVQSAARITRTLDLVARTRIGIVALPLCNLYLQDRQASRSPRQRGIAPLKEIRARGIPVAIASDNTRDAFYAYGDLDVPDLFRDAMRVMQLDHPVGDWSATVTSTAAALLGRPDMAGLRVGGAADLILFSARNWSEFAARHSGDRIVIRGGRPIDAAPPDFEELDILQGMKP